MVIGIGDWEQKKHRKFKEPVKGKGFRSLLRRGGFKVYLVDEFRTSCKCSHCQHEDGKCETFRVRRDPNKKKKTRTDTSEKYTVFWFAKNAKRCGTETSTRPSIQHA